MNRRKLWVGIGAIWVLLGGIGLLAVLAAEEPAAAPPDLAVAHSEPVRQAPRHDAQPDSVQQTKTSTEGPRTQINQNTEPAGDTVPEKPAPRESKPDPRDLQVGAGTTIKTSATDINDLHVGSGGRVMLPAGEVRITGDVHVDPTTKVMLRETDLVLDGGNQVLEGNITARRVVMRNGVKRLRNATLQTIDNGPAKIGGAELVVEAGATLILEQGAVWTTPNSHGFRIEGSLLIDGGEFRCTFTNGSRLHDREESWAAGSSLTVHSGKFIGSGDADFGPAVVTINGGAVEINDDIWGTGSRLTMTGGSFRNSTFGGMFLLTGSVNLHGGNLNVFQNSGRSLRIHADASVYCNGGVVTLAGQPAAGADGGIYVGNSATLPDLVVKTSTKIHKDSLENGYLSVSGDLTIAKGKKFEAKGYQIISNFVPTAESGEFVP